MRLAAVAVLALAASCGNRGASQPPSSVPIAPAAATSPAAPAPKEPKPAVAKIESGGIGDIRVGEPIPARHLADAADARRRYDIRWIEDAQPFEAFRIDDPPVIACFSGPFSEWATDNVGELQPDRFVDEAIQAAKSAPVTLVLIEQQGPVTEQGIGVGSSWDAVHSAHPTTKVLRDPETYDAHPTCRVRLPELPGVQVFLDRCDGGDHGTVKRVSIGRL